jgi:hypothetical protein
LISFKVYGDENFIALLIAANPDKREITVFDADASLNIPDKPKITSSYYESLPPWKRM